MADLPALNLWTDAYMADTTHLSVSESGAYLHLLMAAWRTPDCRLPIDDTLLGRMARCTPREWRKVKTAVMAFWTVDEKTRTVTQKRLVKEKIRALETSKSQARKAKAMWLKRLQTPNAAASAQHEPDASQVDASISISIETPNGVPPSSPPKSVDDEKRRTGRRLPTDWQPTEEHRRLARSKGLGYAETELELSKFKAYYTEGPGRNRSWAKWDQALANWLDKSERPAQHNGQKPRKVDAMMEGIFNAVSGTRPGAGDDAGPALAALPKPRLQPAALAGDDRGLHRGPAALSAGGGERGLEGVPAQDEISPDDF